ncbi:hypothetical protein [Bradyrhizobium sp. USDA 4520]
MTGYAIKGVNGATFVDVEVLPGVPTTQPALRLILPKRLQGRAAPSHFGGIAVWLAPLNRDAIIGQDRDGGVQRLMAFIGHLRPRKPEQVGLPTPR